MACKILLANPVFEDGPCGDIRRILHSGKLTSGEWVRRFEKSLCKVQKVRHAIATSSGTSALHTALLSCGVKAKDEVLTTPLSFVATTNAILYCGARPIFADIDPRTFNLDPESAERIIRKSRNLKAILAVHLYGLPCDLEAFSALARRYGLMLIEDCAQAQGAVFRGRPVGGLGDASAFSFYATKNLGIGEGGAALTNKKSISWIARSLINHGESKNSRRRLGYNYRMMEIQAALGLSAMRKLPSGIQKRRRNAGRLDAGLKPLGWIQTPFVPQDSLHAFHLYTLRVKAELRFKLLKHLKNLGIETKVYYQPLIYDQPYLRNLSWGRLPSCPQAEKASREILSIPVHPRLTKSQIQRILQAFRLFRP